MENTDMYTREFINDAKIGICRDCGKKFLYYHDGSPQKRCPTCTDKQQARPSIVQKREEIRCFENIRIVSLPAKWVHVPPKASHDNSFFKIVIKGSDFGASWNGRIDIFAPEPFGPGESVDIHEIVVEHKIKIVDRIRHTLKYGPVEIENEHPITSDEGEETIRTRHYLRLERAYDVPNAKLVWATAYSKTTLKGYGRQFHASVEDDATIASWKLSGGVRSGRASTTGVLAVVNEDHPLLIKKTGDITGDETYA
jgi:hypothetical protein